MYKLNIFKSLLMEYVYVNEKDDKFFHCS